MPSVLFVDDEPNILAGLRRMLRGKRREWDMAFCESGAAALERLAERPVDVVVSDMRMPGMDGAELLTRVRDLHPEAARIILSGHSELELTLRAVGPAHRYISKPCEAERLTATIESVLGLHRRVRSAEVRRAVSAVDTLPVLPEVYVELVEELRNPDASVEQAGKIIARDLGISSKILQLVNSSFFGLPVRVVDTPHAVALLGLGVIRPLVLSAGVFGQFEGRELGGVSLKGLTAHSTRVAMRAREVAESLPGGVCPDTASDVFLAGLMHDVGRLVLAQSRPGDYAQLVRDASADPAGTPERERDLFGATHAEVGGYLMQLWGLPAPLVEAVALHHTPSEATGDTPTVLAAVHAAEVLTDDESQWDAEYLDREGLADWPQRYAPTEPATAS